MLYYNVYISTPEWPNIKVRKNSDILNFPLDNLCYFQGKCDVTQLILEAGAKTDRLNSVGRTAAQMAAFVG